MDKLNTSFVLGYHGCSASTSKSVLAGRAFKKSDNDYDWLGPGIYFWEGNPRRAISYIRERNRRNTDNDRSVAVLGAVIDLGICLDLTTEQGIEHVSSAYTSMKRIFDKAEVAMPVNAHGHDLLLRKLDCAVLRHLHQVRSEMQAPPLDTVRGVFVEGEPIYENAGFHAKTHIQICVCNPRCIKGVFRVSQPEQLLA